MAKKVRKGRERRKVKRKKKNQTRKIEGPDKGDGRI